MGIFNGLETWIDIIVIACIIYWFNKRYKKYKIKKRKEKEFSMMTPEEKAKKLEDIKKERERLKQRVIDEKREEVDKLNNNPKYKEIFRSLCLQANNTLIVYYGFYYREEEDSICISCQTFTTPEGYHRFENISYFSLEKMEKDRQRFIQLKKELGHFGFEIKPIEDLKRKEPKEKY